MSLRYPLLSLLSFWIGASGCFDLPSTPPELRADVTSDADSDATSEDAQDVLPAADATSEDAQDALPTGDVAAPEVGQYLPGLWLVGTFIPQESFDWYRFGPLQNGTGSVASAGPAGPSLKPYVAGGSCDGSGSWEMLGPHKARVQSPCLVNALTWSFDTDPGELLGGSLERRTVDTALGLLTAFRFPSDYCAELTDCVDPF